MYRLSTSFLVLFFLFSFLHHLSCASNKTQLGWCEAPFQCGNITAGFPFWGGNRLKSCGYGPLELRCNRNNITSLNISNHEYNVFEIDQTLNTLRLARLNTKFIPEEKELNMTRLETVLREGVEVKLKIDDIPCEECSPSAAELRRHCSKRFSCGNQGDLYYPFWIPGREECGHPDFKLDCRGGVAQLNIASVNYIVLYMNFDSRIIRLARSNYMGDLCTQNSLNLPFTENVLPFTGDTKLLTLYYECQFNSSTIYAGELGCDSGRRYYVTRNLSSNLLDASTGLLYNLRGMCKRVSVPVSGSALNTLKRSPNQDNLKKALEKGFEFGFNKDCFDCINSRGGCGYNQTSSINGTITEFPLTAARYKRNRCLGREEPPPYMSAVQPSGLFFVVFPTSLPPAQAPNLVITDADIFEPPLYPFTANAPATNVQGNSERTRLNLSLILFVLASLLLM